MSSLLLLHIITMSLSIVLSAGLLTLTIFKTRRFGFVTWLNRLLTFLGLGSGFILLLSHPLDLRCALLFSYLIAFIAADYYITMRQKQLKEAKNYLNS